ncbi:serine/threonine-protein kinase [Phenylobacterium sp.]|uniref:serine/threonine-protein kinase n=1 Tax=Phenylobacterium sp. TaxID=1871053 RepID=UPI0025D3BC14|nr:serine/threonine-protein kinase [Phenylobacterium sp.]MBX3483439.1 serine/threonine protein kinase [Phenylobacterium sp.]
MASRPLSARAIEARALDLLEQAMDQASDARGRWIAEQDAPEAARARALQLLGVGRDAAMALATGGGPRKADGGPAPERIGAYRITGLIGQGGMGAVYRGERAAGDFEHTTAIKVIRPGALSGSLIERFRRERQTLARLSHPNIARLFDGGETEAREPYIVMELVDGRPLSEWRAATNPSQAQRLDLFLAAASAVAFAHQNLIVHGDVTLANILVDQAGQPKLIDFGISSPASTEAPAALAPDGKAGIHTPGFAAPERIAGAPSTTLSDIYSLGRVLAWLTEGDAPDAELRAIVARATADDPAERYPTVEALRDDVTAWRGGFPVAAVGGGRGYVFGKFVRRHRLAVGGAAAAAILLIAAFGLTLAANARAEAARAEAETRFEDVRTLAKSMMFDVYDEVAKVQGSVDARLKLAQTAQTYLDRLAADPHAPFDVRLEAGEGYFRLGRVMGSTGGGSLGRREEGKALYGRAEAILERLHAERPARADVSLALGHLLSFLAGESLYADGDSKAARARATRARTLLTALPEPSDRSAGALAAAYLYEGDSYGWDNDIPGAGRVYEQGLKIVAALPPALRESDPVAVSLSGLLRQSGNVYLYAGRIDDAVARMQEGVALNRARLAATEGDPTWTRRLVASLWSLGDIQREAGRLDAALATLKDGQDIARAMAARSPTDAGAAESIALTGIVLAQVQSARGAHAQAVAAADEVVAIRRQLAQRSGGNKGSRLHLAVGLKDAAPVYRHAGRTAQACGALRESHAILSGYAARNDLSDYDRENNLKSVAEGLKACGG